MTQNAIPDGRDLAARIAERTLSKRGADYTTEVRRLLDAALDLIRANGTAARPRVADIVAAAGLSNDAFYRHFPSKDALVSALVEDGAERLAGYLAHQMGKEATPEGQVRSWVEGVLSQARGQIAATTLAVLWNGGSQDSGGRNDSSARLAVLVEAPLARLGSRDPALDASLVAHAALGRVSDHLWGRTTPSRDEVDHLVGFCLGAVVSAAG